MDLVLQTLHEKEIIASFVTGHHQVTTDSHMYVGDTAQKSVVSVCGLTKKVYGLRINVESAIGSAIGHVTI